MSVENVVQEFKDYLERITMLSETSSILSFDSETIAPPGSLASRAKRAGFFELEIFQMETSNKMRYFLDILAPHLDQLDDVVRGMYRLSKKAYDDGTKIPAELVKEMGELKEEAGAIWAKARQENDFDSFAPYLSRLIELQKQMICYRLDGEQPYDLLLDDYEDGMTMAIYDTFFEKLKQVVIPLLNQIKASDKQIDKSFVNVPINLKSQRKLSEFLATKLGFDLDRGLPIHFVLEVINTTYE